jgi:hypothetical protein
MKHPEKNKRETNERIKRRMVFIWIQKKEREEREEGNLYINMERTNL